MTDFLKQTVVADQPFVAAVDVLFFKLTHAQFPVQLEIVRPGQPGTAVDAPAGYQLGPVTPDRRFSIRITPDDNQILQWLAGDDFADVSNVEVDLRKEIRRGPTDHQASSVVITNAASFQIPSTGAANNILESLTLHADVGNPGTIWVKGTNVNSPTNGIPMAPDDRLQIPAGNLGNNDVEVWITVNLAGDHTIHYMKHVSFV